MPVSRIDGPTILRTLEGLARYGATSQGGVTRPGFSAPDNAARRFLAAVAADAGLSATVDAAGNVLMRLSKARPGRPALLIGSHLDSVPDGGRLDGAYGVAAAVEVVSKLAAYEPDLALEPVGVAWSNEEGSLFPYLFFGSRALTGTLVVSDITVSRTGESLRDPLRLAGGNLDRIEEARWPPGSVGAYLELHIEQGPVLEHRDAVIGVVDSIVGRTSVDITIHGRAGHAGTTPMALRSDALTAAARVVLAVEAIARRKGICAVATVGHLDVQPNAANVVPGSVRLTAEFRDRNAECLREAERAISADIADVGASTGTGIDVQFTERTHPVSTDPAIRAVITSVADELGLPHLGLPSGAGHDAQIMAALAPVGLIFVPSRDGVSHTAEEDTDDAHLVAGAHVLFHTALELSL